MPGSIKLLNVVGLTLQYFAFWLVAPEILGEKRMRLFEERIGSAIIFISRAAMVFGAFFFGLIGGVLAIAYVAPKLLGGHRLFEAGSGRSTVTDLLIALLLGAAFWGPGVVGGKLGARLADWATRPMLRKLAHDAPFRERCLFVGAILFTFGSLLLVLAALKS
ncbi:MAG TPA: hypothetical protein VJX67_19050 [Blastocatellia bacterium]|nr:hypothetical protein [Blastocatellia bacterium]